MVRPQGHLKAVVSVSVVTAIFCSYNVGDQFQVLKRKLQQYGEVTVVNTAAQLLGAVLKGQQHIEIQSHLDLTKLQARASRLTDGVFGDVPASVQSIRVRRSYHGKHVVRMPCHYVQMQPKQLLKATGPSCRCCADMLQTPHAPITSQNAG